MIGKVRFCSGKVRSKVRQRAVLSPCQCGSGAGIHTNGLQFTTWSFLKFLEYPIYSVKFLRVYYTSLDSGGGRRGIFYSYD